MHPIFHVPVFCLAWLPAVTFASLDNSEYTTSLPIVPVTGSTQHAAGSVVSANDSIHILEAYLNHFESLAQSESWQEMLAQGIRAVDAARRVGRYQDEVKIYAQLTLAAFCFGDYDLALVYVTQCHKLSENLESPALLIRALYYADHPGGGISAKQKIIMC